VICQWADWLDGKRLDRFTDPVFSPTEQAAIREFHTIWRSVIDDTPKMMPPFSDLIGTEPWERLRRGAELALRVFQARGKFDDEISG
jgi:hypothetical protein